MLTAEQLDGHVPNQIICRMETGPNAICGKPKIIKAAHTGLCPTHDLPNEAYAPSWPSGYVWNEPV